MFAVRWLSEYVAAYYSPNLPTLQYQWSQFIRSYVQMCKCAILPVIAHTYIAHALHSCYLHVVHIVNTQASISQAVTTVTHIQLFLTLTLVLWAAILPFQGSAPTGCP